MPGLLVTDNSHALLSHWGIYAVGAELLGTFLFALLGSSAPASQAAWANGLALAVTIYITANISGGHLNPAVSVAAVATGYLPAAKGAVYVVAQILGAVLASLVQALIVPGVVIGDPKTALGGFAPADTVAPGQAFTWELITTFILVSAVIAVAFGEPNFGTVGPFVIGLSLVASAFVAGPLTGAGLNPARVLGPAIVHNYRWDAAWYYVLAELVGGALAGLAAVPLYGGGRFAWWDRNDEENGDPLEGVRARLINKDTEA